MGNWFHRWSGKTSPRKTCRVFPPAVTILESRIALAGNVTAVVAGGNLIIRGDNAGAAITLSQPGPGQITVTGQDTTVNGSAAPVTLSSVKRDVRVFFGDGDDSLTFDEGAPLTVAGNLFVDGGSGSNTVTVGASGPFAAAAGVAALNVGGDLTIHNLPSGTQLVSLFDLSVQGNVRIVNQGGDALTQIDSFGGSNTIGGNLLVADGPGQSDETDLGSIQVKGNVQVLNLGAVAITSIQSFDGSNFIGGDLIAIDGPGQIAQTVIGGTRVGHNLLVAESGQAQNTILILSARVSGITDLAAASGDSTVFVDGATFDGAFAVRTGGGTDRVSIGTGAVLTQIRLVPVQIIVIRNGVEVVETQLRAVQEQTRIAAGPVTFNGAATGNLGDGDDTLSLALGAPVTFKKKPTLDGGNGNNTANVRLANLAAEPPLTHFSVNTV